jgi:deoxyadenosine/deoxycytidine kinase
MNENFKISTIEGHCFSGKTTLLKELEKTYQVNIIEEYDYYAGGGINFPNFPPKSLEEAKSAVKFFIELEKRRTNDAVELCIKYNQPVIMDRSPLACMAFQKVAESQYPDIPKIYAYSMDAFKESAEKGDIILPSVILYIEPPDLEAYMKRVAIRGRLPNEFLNKPETFLAMSKWYKEVISKAFNDSNSLILLSKEGELDLYSYFAYEFLNSATYGISPIFNLEPKSEALVF